MNARKYLAELLGTFLFMMIGYASIAGIPNASAPTPNLLVVPFAFGLGLLAAIFAFGRISGGHFNPAVTVAMILDKRTTVADGAGYVLAQIIGAIGAAALVLVTVSQDAVKAGITKPGAGITDIGALILEIVFTTSASCGSTSSARSSAASSATASTASSTRTTPRPDPTIASDAGPRSSRPRGPRERTAGRCPSVATPSPG